MKQFMKKRIHSLRYNVAIKFLLIIIILSSLLLIFLPLGLKNYFVEESYHTIEQSQVGLSTNPPSMEGTDPQKVNHIILTTQGVDSFRVTSNLGQIDSTFLKEAINHVLKQTSSSNRYVYQSGDMTIYYVVNKTDKVAIISYVYASYVEYYIDSLYHQLFIIILIVLALSIIIAIFLANSITNPLITISKKIKSIAKDNWDDEIKVTRRDEIGDIQHALEEMREHLKFQDKSQREMFQNISHDLKTPIMIIEGYSQSIMDGYVEKNEIPEYISSIMEEAKRLEKKVKSLLYINKIDQLSLEKRNFMEIDPKTLLQTVITPFKTQFPDFNFQIIMSSDVVLKGEFDEWRVALENIVDNMTRFANHEIIIEYSDTGITLFNDGEKIDESIKDNLFKPYGVGTKSNFGLGLAITKKIVNMYGYQIEVENVSNGVKFIIKK